ncbi:unnamed protein product, partial [Ectocarpus sp. 12 AP-2014]
PLSPFSAVAAGAAAPLQPVAMSDDDDDVVEPFTLAPEFTPDDNPALPADAAAVDEPFAMPVDAVDPSRLTIAVAVSEAAEAAAAALSPATEGSCSAPGPAPLKLSARYCST